MKLRSILYHVLDPIVSPGAPVALLDYPNSENVGDNAIWLGELDWLRARGHPLVYVCAQRDYKAAALRRVLPMEGVILFQGGGNFGDLYPAHQRLRESVIRDFPDRRIIQLPQTINFASADSASRSAKIINSHLDFTMLVRDSQSLARAGQLFGGHIAMCPDMAFALAPLFRPIEPTVPLVKLLRKDKEAGDETADEADRTAVDWLKTEDNPWSIRIRRRIVNGAIEFIQKSDIGTVVVNHRLIRQYEVLAKARLDFGLGLLSGGRVVLTDRLHAHILATITGIPNVVLSDRHGKVPDFVNTWTRQSADVHLVASRAEAESVVSWLVNSEAVG